MPNKCSLVFVCGKTKFILKSNKNKIKVMYSRQQKRKSFCKKMQSKFNNFKMSAKSLIKQQVVPDIFEKKFTFQSSNVANWKLPNVDQLFKEFYRIDEFQKLKTKLNEVKSRLNEYNLEEWSKHTRRQDPAGQIPHDLRNHFQAELVTVAWCKFFEILSSFPIVSESKLNSLHLCEAPGAFIAALNHYLHMQYEATDLQWNWKATTLNPYHEENPRRSMITDDRLLLRTLDHWLFHSDFTGNLMSSQNIKHMQEVCLEQFDTGVQLISADGSVDCIDVPDIQEEHVGHLHFAEILSALLILAPAGNFVIKLFTFFEASTISLLYLLVCGFENVHIFKPGTSKRGNSEVYVVCLGYKPHTANLAEILQVLKGKVDEPLVVPIFARAQLPADFLEQVKECAVNFMNWQINAIESNIYAFKQHAPQHLHQMRQLVSQEFMQRFQLKCIDPAYKLLPDIAVFVKQSKAQSLRIFRRKSYEQRREFSTSPLEGQIFLYHRLLNELEIVWLEIPRERFEVVKEQTQVDVQPILGQEVGVLRSSMFVVSDIMLLSEKLEEIFCPYQPYWHLANAQCEIIGDERNILKLNVKSIAEFGKKLHIFMEQLIESIYAEKAKTLIFNNIPFLTHFAVSMLYILAHNYFEKLEFDATDLNNIKVILSGGKNQLNLVNLFQDCSNLNVLCLIKMAHLHDNNFNAKMVQLNNALLLHNGQSLLNTCTKTDYYNEQRHSF